MSSRPAWDAKWDYLKRQEEEKSCSGSYHSPTGLILLYFLRQGLTKVSRLAMNLWSPSGFSCLTLGIRADICNYTICNCNYVIIISVISWGSVKVIFPLLLTYLSVWLFSLHLKQHISHHPWNAVDLNSAESYKAHEKIHKTKWRHPH